MTELPWWRPDRSANRHAYFKKFTMTTDRPNDLRLRLNIIAMVTHRRAEDTAAEMLRNVSLMEALFCLEHEVVHMALPCCSERSSRYIVLTITACLISNYPPLSSDIQHLLCEMICMPPNDRVGLSALPHSLSFLSDCWESKYIWGRNQM